MIPNLMVCPTSQQRSDLYLNDVSLAASPLSTETLMPPESIHYYAPSSKMAPNT